jgi:hypothetical protein
VKKRIAGLIRRKKRLFLSYRSLSVVRRQNIPLTMLIRMRYFNRIHTYTSPVLKQSNACTWFPRHQCSDAAWRHHIDKCLYNVYYNLPIKVKHVILSRVRVTVDEVSDLIYWHRLHTTRNYRQLQRCRWSPRFTVHAYTCTRVLSFQ